MNEPRPASRTRHRLISGLHRACRRVTAKIGLDRGHCGISVVTQAPPDRETGASGTRRRSIFNPTEPVSVFKTLPGQAAPSGECYSRQYPNEGVDIMSNDERTKYFDLHTTGIGYLSRVREVTPEGGDPFLGITIAALRGSVGNVQYTHFECSVSGRKAQATVRELRSAVEGKLKVLIGFTLSNLHAESFTYQNGDKAGQPGVRLKARLLRIAYVKVDGQPFITEHEKAA